MNKRIAERCMLAALIALLVYGLACIYPAAWSPDSSKVVFPVFRKVKDDTSICALVMVDLSGKAIRDVASVEPGKAQLGAASWSPDGKWIAYMKSEEIKAAPAPAAEPASASKPAEQKLLLSIMLQDAQKGSEKCLMKKEGREDSGGAPPESLMYGPSWLADSKTLAAGMNDGLLTFVNLEGRPTKEIPLGENRIPTAAPISPDGRYMTFLDQVDEKNKTANLCLMEIAGEAAKTVDRVAVSGDIKLPLAWTADSSAFYYASSMESDKKKIAFLKKFDLRAGKVSTVREEPEGVIWGITLSHATGFVEVDFSVVENSFGVQMVNPSNGEATPIHFSTEPHYSTAVSPDGQWVALNWMGKDSELSVGLILSSDGKDVRFFLPEPKMKEKIPEILKDRLLGALACADAKNEIDIKMLMPESRQEVADMTATMDKFAALQKAPLMKEAAAFGKVYLIMEGISQAKPEAKEALADAARKELDVFLKAYPKYPLDDLVREEIENMLKSKPAPETMPATESGQAK